MANFAQVADTGAERIIGASLHPADFGSPMSCEAGSDMDALVVAKAAQVGLSGTVGINALAVHIDPVNGALTQKAQLAGTTGLIWTRVSDGLGGYQQTADVHFGSLVFGGGTRWWLPYKTHRVGVNDEVGIIPIDLTGSALTIGSPVHCLFHPATLASNHAALAFRVPIAVVLDDRSVVVLCAAPNITDNGLGSHQDVYVWVYKDGTITVPDFLYSGIVVHGFTILPSPPNWPFPLSFWNGVAVGDTAVFMGYGYTFTVDSSAVASSFYSLYQEQDERPAVNIEQWIGPNPQNLHMFGNRLVVWGRDGNTALAGSAVLDLQGRPISVLDYDLGTYRENASATSLLEIGPTHRALKDPGFFLTYGGAFLSGTLLTSASIPPSQTVLWQIAPDGTPVSGMPKYVKNDPQLAHDGSTLPLASMTLLDPYVLVAPASGPETCYVVRINTAPVNNLRTEGGKPMGVNFW